MITQQFTEEEIEDIVEFLFANREQKRIRPSMIFYFSGIIALCIMTLCMYIYKQIYFIPILFVLIILYTIRLIREFNKKKYTLRLYKKKFLKERHLQITERSLVVNNKLNISAERITHIVRYKNYIFLYFKMRSVPVMLILKEDEQLDVFIHNLRAEELEDQLPTGMDRKKHFLLYSCIFFWFDIVFIFFIVLRLGFHSPF